MFRVNDIIILIGAGCSFDAGIPMSGTMLENLEKLIKNDWKDFEKLYYFLKASIVYSDGIRGEFNKYFDIERLVNVLNELIKKENSVLYPFIGAWNKKLIELVGYNFDGLKKFRDKILEKLIRWVDLEHNENASYYKNFFRFQKQLNYPLRIFSLNYDLCFKTNIPEGAILERGFDENTKTWNWRRFEASEEYSANIYLYKLHGSLDWNQENGVVKEYDKRIDSPLLIFGTNYKMQYIDPFLFNFYELRKYSLDAILILTIGYSFRDEHINGILFQALNKNLEKRIMVVTPNSNKIVDRIIREYSEINKDQFITIQKTAKEFLENIDVNKIYDRYEKSLNHHNY